MAAVGRLRVRGASQVLQVCAAGERVLRGSSMRGLAVVESKGTQTVGVAVDEAGKIAAVGYDSDLDSQFSGWSFEKELDANGGAVVPGLVDAHTHPVWEGDRVNEFAMKLAGATYMDIHSSGGGIYYTVGCVRQAHVDQLASSFSDRLSAMMRCGTTTVEAKTGYGLDLESEVKMLRAIERVRKEHPISVSVTYCGAHAVPKGSTSDEATQNIINVQIPSIADLCSSGELRVDNIDVFCEKGVFDTDQTREILLTGKQAGWNINFHGDELHSMNSGELAAEVGALAVSHLEEVSPSGITAMSDAGVVAVLLPTTAYILRLKPPPARDMMGQGVAVALGSDFNPNAFCMSMPLVMHLACVTLRMTMEEALAAATINAAAALGVSDKCGSLEEGKMADMLILNASRWEHLIYQFGCHDQVIRDVIKSGRVLTLQTTPSACS